MICKNVKENVLQEASVTKETFAEWRNQHSHYAKSQCMLNEAILESIVEQGQIIWHVFEVCER